MTARTAVPVTTLAGNTNNADVASTAGTAIDATNSHSITPPAGCPIEELLIRITNTTSSTKAATIKAGANPPADAAGQGDLTVSLGAGNSVQTSGLVVLTSARFAQADGTINIDIASGMTGFITVFRIPRSV